MTKPKLIFRQLTGEDVLAFKDIRLEALKKHPEHFTACYTQESKRPVSFFSKMLERNTFIACLRDGKILGICGVLPAHESPKKAHTAKISGFYIRPEYRGRGFARKLMDKALDAIEEKYDKVMLDVNARNRGAVKLYKKMGFVNMGFEPRCFKLADGTYVDTIHMFKFLD